ncbi:TAXI family TRAP transporter solute-binding subunit [Microvirga sp. TS319]|uniref:TAXI family TRAP transporter solute-binding subunit n=1 Tax=Microvirga sp. TS319 TaxID=3241165 RepID=UPI003519DA42
MPPIRIVSGEENSAYSRTIADLATILDGDDPQLQAIASQGPVEDLLKLINRPEADVAIVQTDALRSLPESLQGSAKDELRYIFQVPSKELHVLAPRGITEIGQLEGRKVNIDRVGTGTHLTARRIFQSLGIRPEFTTDDQRTAQQRLVSGEIQAAILLASSPSSEVLAFPSEGQFHLLPLPAGSLAPDYPPARFTSDDYPHLVEADEQVATAAVSRVLAVRNWPEGSSRYRRLVRLAQAIDAHSYELDRLGHPPRWKDIREAGVPGWLRFKPVQDLLELRIQRTDEQRAFETFATSEGNCSLPISWGHYEDLYKDFIEWRRARENGGRPTR